MLLITPTIIHNCNGGCDDEDMNNKFFIEFTTRNNNNKNHDNKDLTESHVAIPTSYPINKS